jgi:hypothetical protein
MGCDIHGYVERRHKEGDWKRWILSGEVEGNRNYVFFGLLNGVREDLRMFEDRGFPKDASDALDSIKDRWDGDGHSHSWISKHEVERALASESKLSITRFWPTENLARLRNGDWEAMYPCCGGTTMEGWEQATLSVPFEAVGARSEFQWVLDYMNRFSEYETRFVFWFDN